MQDVRIRTCLIYKYHLRRTILYADIFLLMYDYVSVYVDLHA